MVVGIQVKNSDDATALKAAMAEPRVRAVTLICGHLLAMGSPRERQRVLQWVHDCLDDEENDAKAKSKQVRNEEIQRA